MSFSLVSWVESGNTLSGLGALSGVGHIDFSRWMSVVSESHCNRLAPLLRWSASSWAQVCTFILVMETQSKSSTALRGAVKGANWKGPLGCLMGALHWRFSKHVHLGGHSGIDPGIELIGEIMYLAWECLKVPQEELVNATLSLLPQWSDSGKWKKMDRRMDGWSVTGEYAYILPMVLLYIAFNLNLFFLEAENFPLWLTVFSKTCWIVPKIHCRWP